MGSKGIFVVGTLVSGAFLYYSIYKTSMPSTISKNNIEQSQISKTKIDAKLEVLEKETKVVKVEPEVTKKEAISEEVVIEEVIERISIPAFGFMSSKNKNQIVALMSDNEKDGELSKYLKWLCAKKECSKDIRFENNIMDSSWQKGAVKIIELFEDESISGGSLFIESDTLKLEGKVNSKEAQNRLDLILESLKNTNLKIQSYIKLADFAEQQFKPQKIETPKVVEVAPTEAPKITKVTKPIVKEVVKPAEVVKPVVRPAPKPEIVPEPFMETTLDVPVQKAVVLDESVYLIEDAQIQLDNILKTEAITFEGSTNLISENSKKTLQKLIKLINTLNSQEIKVSGFTDFSSDKVYNKVLSQKRADTITRYLKNRGLKSKHIKSIGYGDAKPSNGDNVAIEIEILGETK